MKKRLQWIVAIVLFGSLTIQADFFITKLGGTTISACWSI